MAAGFIELEFGDGTYRFRLLGAELRELQSLCDAGPFEIFNRLSVGFPRFDDIRETIRLGLVGGKMGWKGRTADNPLGGEEVIVDTSRANRLVATYVDTYAGSSRTSWHSSRMLAQAIIGAGLVGVPDEPIGEKKAEEGTEADPNPSLTAKSAGLPSSPASPNEE